MSEKFQKGSEWRRWDLHIHTPGTKKNDQFRGSTIEEKWEAYIEDINNYTHEIAAVAITDYLCIDNYFIFKKFIKEEKITKAIPLILPNIELRIIPVTGKEIPINIHCIFNPIFEEKIFERFLHKLMFHDGNRNYSASKQDLIELGRIYKNQPGLPEEAAIKEAINQYVVPIKVLKDLFTSDTELKNNTIIVVSNKSTDGASGLAAHCEIIEGEQYNALDATRQAIYRFTEGIFSANPKDIIYFVGCGVDSQEEVMRKCFSLKPCFHGSDAHENAKIFEPDLKRYCWLKANPTFNGFRQTLFEPTTRVRIGEEKPELKKDYLVIDSVKFVSNTSDKIFSPEKIELNDKLNSIIGGKSSGKSLLLYYIAKTIDAIEVEKKFKELQIYSEYEFDKIPDFEFQVIWRDGVTYSLKQTSTEKNRQITYIPQMYINYLAEKRGKEGLKNLIQSFLEEKETFDAFLKKIQKAGDEAKIALTTAITQFFQQKEQFNKTSENIRNKGDKQARIQNVRDKNIQLAGLRAIAGFTEDDERKFEELEKNKKIHADRLISLQLLLNTYKTEYPSELQKILQSIETSFDNYSRISISKFVLHSIIGNSLTKQYKDDKEKVVTLFQSLISSSSEKAIKAERVIDLTSNKIKNYENELQPYLDKIQNREKLLALQNEISNEQTIIDQIEELERLQIIISSSIEEEYKNIIAFYGELLSQYKKSVEEINSNPAYSEISSEKKIHLKAFIDFDVNRFSGACTNFINKQSYFSNIFGEYFDGNNSYIFDKEQHLSNFEDFLKKILFPAEHGIRFNQGGNIQNVTRSLFDDYFSVNYELSQDGEDILKMSPGKKGLILLFLILHLSNADYPILIDQPEDNLDNRTVYTELKDFIKLKKIERQIIIVTHNANLVVPTDAENVIVANQEGQDAGKDNELYKFEYISGALENTFRDKKAKGILNQMGIKEHVCEILEGGEIAFMEREKRYSLKID